MVERPRRVMVIDDDPTLTDVVDRYLTREGFSVAVEADGQRGLDQVQREPPDLVVLDVMLPGIDGLEVCRRLRAGTEPRVPVIMLTARGEESDRVRGLDLGADDYLVKPFSLRELGARIRAVLRRADEPQSPGGILSSGTIRVDPQARIAWRDEVPLNLTVKEFDLLVHLMRHPGVARRRDELLESVWGWTFGDTATVTVHIRRLREKIEADSAAPRHVVTVWGVGYRWEP